MANPSPTSTASGKTAGEAVFFRKDGRAQNQLRPLTLTPGFVRTAEGSVLIHQDAKVYAGLFDGSETAKLEVAGDRSVYVHRHDYGWHGSWFFAGLRK